MALACHARIVADDPGIRLGLPEVAIGLMPGFGGTQRLPRLVDYKAALRAMAEGRTWSPQEALALGAVTETVAAGALAARARAWVLANPGAVQPWTAAATPRPPPTAASRASSPSSTPATPARLRRTGRPES